MAAAMPVEEIALLGGSALGLLLVFFRAVGSPLRPFVLPLDAWRAALASVRAAPGPVALAALVIGAGAGLQLAFTYGPRIDGPALTYASLAWQALVAMLMAMIAVPIQRTLIAREPEGFMIERPTVARSGWRALLLPAGPLGGALWLIAYLVAQAGRLAAVSVPADWAGLADRGGQLAGFATVALLALVRPALSSGLPNPIGSGLRAALAHAPALLTVQALMLLPPVVFGAVAIELVRVLFGLGVAVQILNVVSVVVFSVLQFLASEAAALLFLRTTILTPAPDTYHWFTYAELRAR